MLLTSLGRHQTTYAGFGDCFLVKFNTNGVRQWGTYYGGVSDDRSPSITTDGAGNVYLAAYTRSANNIASPGSHKEIFSGFYGESFMAKFDSTGIRLWGTYFGAIGTIPEWKGIACVTNSQGEVLLIGSTASDTGIATPGAFIQSNPNPYYGGTASFFSKFAPNGNLVWGSYYVGGIWDCATDVFGNFYLTGAAGNDSTHITPGANQTTYGGNGDAFLAKFTECDNYLIIFPP